MGCDFLENKYKTLDDGVLFLKRKWEMYSQPSSMGMLGACIYYDCCDLAAELLEKGVSEDKIKEVFPAYFEEDCDDSEIDYNKLKSNIIVIPEDTEF